MDKKAKLRGQVEILSDAQMMRQDEKKEKREKGECRTLGLGDVENRNDIHTCLTRRLHKNVPGQD